MATDCQPGSQSLSGAEFKHKLRELRRTDNYHNWYYLARTYALLVAAIGGAFGYTTKPVLAGLLFFGMYRYSSQPS